jgi:hypothetical protein
VRVKAKVPIRVAIKCIELAKGGAFPLIGPCKMRILKMNFIKLTCLKSGSEAVGTASIDVSFVLSQALQI